MFLDWSGCHSAWGWFRSSRSLASCEKLSLTVKLQSGQDLNSESNNLVLLCSVDPSFMLPHRSGSAADPRISLLLRCSFFQTDGGQWKPCWKATKLQGSNIVIPLFLFRFFYQPSSIHGWTSAFLLTVHRLCGVFEGRLGHFLPRWLRTGWQSVISQGKIPWNTPPWLGNEPGPRGGQTVSYPTELSWLVWLTLIDWRVNCSIVQLTDWFIDKSVYRLIDKLTNRLTDWSHH